MADSPLLLFRSGKLAMGHALSAASQSRGKKYGGTLVFFGFLGKSVGRLSEMIMGPC